MGGCRTSSSSSSLCAGACELHLWEQLSSQPEEYLASLLLLKQLTAVPDAEQLGTSGYWATRALLPSATTRLSTALAHPAWFLQQSRLL